MKNTLISVIVPVYNNESYLSECLDSLINQTLNNIEIITINDGSTDSSTEIIKNFKQKSNKIINIDKRNTGLGDTYNVGIRKAKGKYIAFVESDDFIHHDMLRILFETAVKHNFPDMIKGTYYEYSNGLFNEKNKFKDLSLLDTLIKDPIDVPLLYLGHPSHWSAIYNREFILKNNIKYNTTPGAAFQDSGFSFLVYCHLKTFVIINKPLYYYRLDNISSSTNFDPIKSFVLNLNERYYIYTLFDKYKIDSSFMSIEAYKLLQSTKHYLRILLKKRISHKSIYKLLLQEKILLKKYSHTDFYLFSFKEKIQYKILMFFPYIYTIIAKLKFIKTNKKSQ